MQVWVGVQEQPHNDMMLAILVAYLHNIKYAYRLLLSVSMHFVLPHDRVKSVYKSQTIGPTTVEGHKRVFKALARLST